MELTICPGKWSSLPVKAKGAHSCQGKGSFLPIKAKGAHYLSRQREFVTNNFNGVPHEYEYVLFPELTIQFIVSQIKRNMSVSAKGAIIYSAALHLFPQVIQYVS